MNYRISRGADTDIERICNRIAEDNRDAADRLDEQIHRAIQLLAAFPGMVGLENEGVDGLTCSRLPFERIRLAIRHDGLHHDKEGAGAKVTSCVVLDESPCRRDSVA